MGVYFENFGLKEDFFEEEHLSDFITWSLMTGREVNGYYGVPYINRDFGWPEIMCRLKENENGKYEFDGLNTHCSGVSFWEVVLTKPVKSGEQHRGQERRIIASRRNGHGLAVINVVNADVLPSYAYEEMIKLQMIAFPEMIRYFADEDAYFKDEISISGNDIWVIEDGGIFPYGMLLNSENMSEGKESDEHLADLMLIRGTVKKVETGFMVLPSQEGPVEHNSFVDVYIDTEFGPLEIIHNPDDVNENERDLIKEGSTVFCLAYLSGDAAVEEYEDGFVKDHENNIKALSYSIGIGDPERLRSILTEETEFYSETTKKTIVGADEIISKINRVKEANCGGCFAKTATITAHSSSALEWPTGTRCIVLGYEDLGEYESIMFTEEDSEGNISKISVINNPDYIFIVDDYYTEDDSEPLSDSGDTEQDFISQEEPEA